MNGSNVFVFGSNLAGRHGLGAALEAVRNHGAVYGCGQGMQGNSYAIPTKDEYLTPLPLSDIQLHVSLFLVFAMNNSHLTFNVTRVGCGLAGWTDEDISGMFHGAPHNVILPTAWGGDGFDW